MAVAIVVRPDTIVYLACSIINNFKNKFNLLRSLVNSNNFDNIIDWTEPIHVIPYLSNFIEKIDRISLTMLEEQAPFLMQPIWKIKGKSPKLVENCLDIFVWSNLAFIRLFLELAKTEQNIISRNARSVIWLFKMIYDFSIDGQINHRKIIDTLSYNTKNDKAFAVSGKITHLYMTSEFLEKPRITKAQIKEIILGGGQYMLSPERRFDAIIYNSSDIFD